MCLAPFCAHCIIPEIYGLIEEGALMDLPVALDSTGTELALVPGSKENGNPEEQGDKRCPLWLVILPQALLANISSQPTAHTTANLCVLSWKWDQH